MLDLFLAVVLNPVTIITTIITTYRTFKRHSDAQAWARSFLKVLASPFVYAACAYLGLVAGDRAWTYWDIKPDSYVGMLLMVIAAFSFYGSPFVLVIWIGIFIGRIFGFVIDKCHARFTRAKR